MALSGGWAGGTVSSAYTAVDSCFGDTGGSCGGAVTGLGIGMIGPGKLGAGFGAIAAQRTSFEPCVVIGPRLIVVSDSRWRGVSPHHEARCPADVNLVTSPIPSICWIAW